MNRANLLSLIEKNKHKLLLGITVLIGMLFFSILLLVNQRIPGSDDTVFQSQTTPFTTIFDWIMYRYQTWSGRIFSEGFVYIFSNASLWYWKFITVIVYALFVGILFLYYKLIHKNRTKQMDIGMLIVAFCMIFLMDKSVLAEGGLWVTGSMVYFWVSTLGLLAFYPPLHYFIKGRQPHFSITIIGAVAGAIAASSQEQVGLLLLGFSIVLLAYRVYQSPKIARSTFPWYHFIFVLLFFGSLLVSILAPGNIARSEAELLTWLPDLHTVSLTERIQYSYRWFLEAFINHTGFILIGIWLMLAGLFAAKKHKTIVDQLFIFILIAASIFVLAKGSDALSYVVTFYATWKPSLPNQLVSFNLIPWGLVVIATTISPVILYKNKPIGYVLSLLFVATIASTLILLFAPTMYASLWRSFFVPSVVLIVLFFILMSDTLYTFKKYQWIIVSIVICLAAAHYFFQLTRLLI